LYGTKKVITVAIIAGNNTNYKLLYACHVIVFHAELDLSILR